MRPLRHLLPVLSLAAACVAPAIAANFETFGDGKAIYSFGSKLGAGLPIYFTSGAVAGIKAGETMKAQALGTLKNLSENVAAAGLSLSDVAFVRAYLAPGADGKVDFAGWNEAWKETFGTDAQPGKPARTTIAVPLLGRPGNLIEIEFVCVTDKPDGIVAGSDKLGLPVTNSQLKPYGTKDGRIYAGMGVLPGAGMYWTAGSTAPVLDEKLPVTDRGHKGDMYTQAKGTLERLKKNLEGVGLTFADVVYLRCFVGPDGFQGGKFDLENWNKAYGEFFNSPSNPHKPARTTVTTPVFGGDTLLEVEIVAAFPKDPGIVPAGAAVKAYGDAKAVISSGMALAPGKSLYFSAGALSEVSGDMKTQGLSALSVLQKRIEAAGFSFKDVVFLRAYVKPGADGAVDRKGWGEAYTTYFNNPTNPHKPARTTIAVLDLPKPEALIEIDAIVAAP